jgi:hypothetical protein
MTKKLSAATLSVGRRYSGLDQATLDFMCDFAARNPTMCLRDLEASLTLVLRALHPDRGELGAQYVACDLRPLCSTECDSGCPYSGRRSR